MFEELSIFLQKPTYNVAVKQGSIADLISLSVEPKTEITSKNQKQYIALIGINDTRGHQSDDLIFGELSWRNEFYTLYPSESFQNTIIDLGDLKQGNSVNDSYEAIASITAFLVKKNIIPIFFGGSHNTLFGVYNGFEKLEQVVNLAIADHTIDITDEVDGLMDNNFLSSIILKQPNYLFNLNMLGYQTYLVQQSILHLLDKLNFDKIRLGALRPNLLLVEPYIRSADIFSLDCSSIKSADFYSGLNKQPNGFSSEEICQMARYAGMNEKLLAFSLTGFANTINTRNTDKQLIAQVLWCFIDGVFNRKFDYPLGSKETLKKYSVTIKESDNPIIFYKSLKTDRWWMEVPFVRSVKKNYIAHSMVPCTYDDYLAAGKNEIPDLWIKTAEKLK